MLELPGHGFSNRHSAVLIGSTQAYSVFTVEAFSQFVERRFIAICAFWVLDKLIILNRF